MKKRPTLKCGDVVKLSKKARSIDWPRNAPVIVISVSGNGDEKYDVVRCKPRGTYTMPISLYRYELWKTGYNAFDKTTEKIFNEERCNSCNRMKDVGHPCWWCGCE